MKKIASVVALLILFGGGCSTPDAFLTEPAATDPITEYLLQSPHTDGVEGIGEKVFASYEELGRSEDGNILYLDVIVESYGREGTEIKSMSGMGSPVALHTDMTAEGLVVKSAEWPEDGSGYGPSIRRIFPLVAQVKLGVSTQREQLMNENRKKAIAYFATLKDEVPELKDQLFSRQAHPILLQVELDGTSITIPYSSEWSVGGRSLSAYGLEYEGEDMTVQFGMPVNMGTYIGRRYYLLRQPMFALNDLVLQNLSQTCPFGPPARSIMLNETEGIQFYVGGAKGCALGYLFNRGTYSYQLRQVPDLSDPLTLSIDEEMRTIVQSIKE